MPHTTSYYTGLLSNGNIIAFLSSIRKFESSSDITKAYRLRYHPDYITYFTPGNPWMHPNLPELIKHGVYSGQHSTAAGGYQFLYSTWSDIQQSYSLFDFSPPYQDIAALTLMSDKVIGFIKNGQIELALKDLSHIWASMPFSTAGQNSKKLTNWLDAYKSYGGLIDTESISLGNTNNISSDENTVITSDGKIAPATQLNFDKIAQNINTQELDDTEVSWGNRSTSSEESDYIGLKQYIIYLITRYYPQSLIPFVELIPNFKIDSPADERALEERNAAALAGIIYGLDKNDILNKKHLESDDKLIDENRYNRTAKKLTDLQNQGGTDVTLPDPFEEFSNGFNTPNENGLSYSKKRGFSYKIYGNLVLNPSSDTNDLSKPGAIGLTGITIENGSQTQNGMTYITVKIRDVQGNKLLDVNSPWSFLLNQVPGKVGGEFFFRYGWQIRIPRYDKNNSYNSDPTAGKFWNHPGWAGIFFSRTGENNDNFDKGNQIKEYLSSLAETADGTLTFPQSISSGKSFTNAGYEKISEADGSVSFKVKRDIDLFNYLPLTLIQPDININPHDGSVEAVLGFRTNSATANCLCPLNGVGLKVFNIRALCSGAGDTVVTLAALMTAFVKDNRNYVNVNPAMADLNNSNNNTNSIFYADNNDISSWLTVIGGAGTDSILDVNPENINVVIATDFKDQIINSTVKDTTLLIDWLNKVLVENNMAILTAADKSSGASLQEGFIIAYDAEKKQTTDGEIKSTEDSKLDITFSNYLRYVENDINNKFFIGKRLLVQDDVFSFRFQGSLVEEINIEKLNAPNAASIASQKTFAESQGEGDGADSLDVTKQLPNQKTVSITDKKRNLNILYSTMLGLKVTAICHPWIKLARPCFVKGMGFFDGKYTVTKVTHELSNSGKFISIINGVRVEQKNLIESKNAKASRITGSLMNNPGAYKAEQYNGIIPRGSAIKSTAPANSIPTGALESLSNTTNSDSNYLTPFSNNVATPKLRTELENYIKDLHFSYQEHFRSFITEFENNTNGYKIKITSGYRTFAKQAELKLENSNNASPGHSTHNYGLAIDINIFQNGVLVASKDSSDFSWAETGIITIANKYGLTWGGNSFGGYHDRVHFGLDKTFDTGILLAQCKAQFGENFDNYEGNKVKFTG